MTQTGYSNAVVNIMLGWLKGLAGWVLKLFNLAGSGGSPLLWLSQNWLKLLIVLLVLGVAMDWLVWMIRWRPYWIWLRRKRIIVNDEKMLREDMGDAEDEDGLVMEQRYVVPSTVVKRSAPKRKPSRAVSRPAAQPVRRKPRPVPQTKRPERRRVTRDVFSDDLFEVGHDRGEVSDFYEDEVFNVSSLPDVQPARRTRKRHR